MVRLPGGYFISPCSAGHGRQQLRPCDRPASHPQSTRLSRFLEVQTTMVRLPSNYCASRSHTGKAAVHREGIGFQSINKIGICDNWLALHSVLAATCPPTCPPSSLEDRCASRTDDHQARPRIPAAANVVHPLLEGGRGRVLHEGGKHTAPGQATAWVAHLPTNQSFYESPLASHLCRECPAKVTAGILPLPTKACRSVKDRYRHKAGLAPIGWPIVQ